jgi:hypothetical protein
VVSLEAWGRERRLKHEAQLELGWQSVGRYQAFNDAVAKGDWVKAQALLAEQQRAAAAK